MFCPAVSAPLAMLPGPLLGCLPWCLAAWMPAHLAGKRRDGLSLVPSPTRGGVSRLRLKAAPLRIRPALVPA